MTDDIARLDDHRPPQSGPDMVAKLKADRAAFARVRIGKPDRAK